MAIKVISKPVGKPIYQGQCVWCHCRFEFEHSDANTFCDDQREGFSYNVTCPCCGRHIWIDREILRYE